MDTSSLVPQPPPRRKARKFSIMNTRSSLVSMEGPFTFYIRILSWQLTRSGTGTILAMAPQFFIRPTPSLIPKLLVGKEEGGWELRLPLKRVLHSRWLHFSRRMRFTNCLHNYGHGSVWCVSVARVNCCCGKPNKVRLLTTWDHLFIQLHFCPSQTEPYMYSVWGSLVPRPRPAFHRLQYGKARRAWYLFSCEHDIIGKWQKFSEQTGCVLRIVQLTTRSTLGVYNNRPPLARYVR